MRHDVTCKATTSPPQRPLHSDGGGGLRPPSDAPPDGLQAVARMPRIRSPDRLIGIDRMAAVAVAERRRGSAHSTRRPARSTSRWARSRPRVRSGSPLWRAGLAGIPMVLWTILEEDAPPRHVVVVPEPRAVRRRRSRAALGAPQPARQELHRREARYGPADDAVRAAVFRSHMANGRQSPAPGRHWPPTPSRRHRKHRHHVVARSRLSKDPRPEQLDPRA